jgi:hypothetical protein
MLGISWLVEEMQVNLTTKANQCSGILFHCRQVPIPAVTGILQTSHLLFLHKHHKLHTIQFDPFIRNFLMIQYSLKPILPSHWQATPTKSYRCIHVQLSSASVSSNHYYNSAVRFLFSTWLYAYHTIRLSTKSNFALYCRLIFSTSYSHVHPYVKTNHCSLLWRLQL